MSAAKPPMIVGLDTSNYRTSLAAVTPEGETLLDYRELLPVPEGGRGLRQSEAVFAHTRQMRNCLDALRRIGKTHRITAVAASVKPRDGDESYMPVFQVGHTLGAVLAAAEDAPFYPTTHQRGHLAAALQGTALEQEDRLLALHLSGGTTDLLKIEGETVGTLGGSADLHAGQLVDRVGVALGLGFPAGEALEKLAARGKSRGLLGVSMEDGGSICHFSGAETQTQRWILEGRMSPEDIAREVYDLLARTVLRLLKAGQTRTGFSKALVTGGVASSPLLREMLARRGARDGRGPELVFGLPQRSGDNAVGVALIGAKRWKLEQRRNETAEGNYVGENTGR